MRRVLFFVVLLFALPAGAMTIDWVTVADPGYTPDTASNCVRSRANCGSVPYEYLISRYEITNAQYAEFLNAKAAPDPLSLYNSSLDSDDVDGGITRRGTSGFFTYSVKDSFANKPVNYVSFYVAIRLANWLNNGQGSADTETAPTRSRPTGSPTTRLRATPTRRSSSRARTSGMRLRSTARVASTLTTRPGPTCRSAARRRRQRRTVRAAETSAAR